MNAAISISYPANHVKGDKQVLDGAEHAEMLYGIVKRYRSEVDWPIFICCTSFGGVVDYSNDHGESKESLLSFSLQYPDVYIIGTSEVTGHLEGSTWSIWQGVKAAQYKSIQYLIHTCEDVIPERGIVNLIYEWLNRDFNLLYVGETWREQELSTQFFGCRVPWFYENFKGKGSHGLLVEKYMAHLLTKERLRKEEKIKLIPRLYRHTHTPKEFMKMLEE